MAACVRASNWPRRRPEVSAWLPAQADQLTLFLLSSAASPPADGTHWRPLAKARDSQADALMELAQQSVAAGRPSIALELVTEAAPREP